MGNTFESFSDLPADLQVEALREAEIRLNAQLSAAFAADQRALTWGGLLLTGATAAVGGAFALLFKSPPEPELPYLALGFSAMLFLAAGLSVRTVAPKLYCFPGNRPGLWLPEEWECNGSEQVKIATSRREQAYQLNKSILENAKTAEDNARDMRLSFGVAFFAVLAAWICFLIYLLAS